MNESPWFMAHLGLEVEADRGAIRRAYAHLLKQLDQASEAQAFQRLREAYEAALAWTEHRAAVNVASTAECSVPSPSPSNEIDKAAPLPPRAERHDPAHHHAKPSAEIERDPRAEANAVFADFENAISSLDEDVGKIGEALRMALQSEELIPLNACEWFEWRVIARLASGWRMGNAALFDVAAEVFGWKHDQQRLRHFGPSVAYLDAAISEAAAFAEQPEKLRKNQWRLIHRLRVVPQPGVVLLLRHRALLRRLVDRFPSWLSTVAPVAHVEQWKIVDERVPSWLNWLSQKPLQTVRRFRIGFRWNYGWTTIWVLWIIVHAVSTLDRSDPSLGQHQRMNDAEQVGNTVKPDSQFEHVLGYSPLDPRQPLQDAEMARAMTIQRAQFDDHRSSCTGLLKLETQLKKKDTRLLVNSVSTLADTLGDCRDSKQNRGYPSANREPCKIWMPVLHEMKKRQLTVSRELTNLEEECRVFETG